MAHQTGALSPANVTLPSEDSDSSDLWVEWRSFFAALDQALIPEESGRQQDSPGLFAFDPFFERYRPGDDALHEAFETASQAACGTPYETLSRTYERLLSYEPGRSAAGHPVLQSCRRQRRANGSFYTPLPIARLTVEETLRPILAEETRQAPQIMDPAMGTGSFLLEAAKYLHQALPLIAPRRVPSALNQGMATRAHACLPVSMTLAEIAEECLHGVDLDPLAVQLAIHAIWIETGARPRVVARHLRAGNFLGKAAIESGITYDAVVGNPPWGPEHDGAKEDGRRPRARRDSIDRFKLFLRLGAKLSHGTLGMIVPQAVLAQSTHGDIRSLLLKHYDPYSVIDLGNRVFPAAAPACALVFGPKPGPAQVRHARLRDQSLPFARSLVPRSQCTEDGFLLSGTEVLEFYARLRDRHPTLGVLTAHLRVRDVGINYNRASVARHVLYDGSEPDDPRDLPRYRGRDFDRYTSIRPGGWLRHDALSRLGNGEHLSLSWPTYLLPRKIVLRQTADRLVATLDHSRMAMGRSVIALTAESEVSLPAVLACLNSHLLTVLYRALAGEEGRLLPQVKVGRLTSLPLPPMSTVSLSPDMLRDAEPVVAAALQDGNASLLRRAADDPVFCWAALDRLVGRLLQLEGRDHRVDDLIDQLVCLSYNLSPEEKEIISNLTSNPDVRTGPRPTPG